MAFTPHSKRRSYLLLGACSVSINERCWGAVLQRKNRKWFGRMFSRREVLIVKLPIFDVYVPRAHKEFTPYVTMMI